MPKLIFKSKHRVMCGDCTVKENVKRLMGEEKADMVFTDPPYKLTSGGDTNPDPIFKKTLPSYSNNGKLFEVPEFSEWVPLMAKILKQDADIYSMSNDKNLLEMLKAFESSGIRLHNILVMGKNNHGGPNRWYLKNCEFVIYGFIGNAKKINNLESTTLQMVKMPDNKTHPTQKPVEYIQGIIENSSLKGEIIFEPFLGSGSTLIACDKTNRRCFGMEIDPHYIDVIVKRYSEFTKQTENIFLEREGKKTPYSRLIDGNTPN